MLKCVSLGIVAVCTAVGLSAAQSDPNVGTFEDVAAAMSASMRLHHFNPAALSDPAYLATEKRIADLAIRQQTRDEFVRAVNAIWRNGPFSHVRLQVARATADETAAQLDTLRVGGGRARLTWNGDVAVLTVTTMMGLDTLEEIAAAYTEIARRGARALIIDIRKNDGGAFAVNLLVGHVLDAPLDAGAFTSRRWAAEMNRPPNQGDVAKIAPWEGWTLTAFWRDVESSRITRLRFQPLAPAFSGPAFVLISRQTASAAELAADAFKASGRAVLVGETTAGRMLSQKVFDLPRGLQFFLPIADYYSFHSGRIEGTGVVPHVRSDPNAAMAVALELAARR